VWFCNGKGCGFRVRRVRLWDGKGCAFNQLMAESFPVTPTLDAELFFEFLSNEEDAYKMLTIT